MPVVVAGALLAVGAGCGGDKDGGDYAVVTFTAVLPDGSPPTVEALEEAAGVLARRLDAAGLDDPQVRVDRERIVATFASDVDRELLETLATPGELRFRKVLAQTAASGAPGQDGDGPAVYDPGTVAERQSVVAATIDGETMQAALAILQPSGESDPETLLSAVGPFGELTGPEVSILPTRLQFYLPTITCQQLGARPIGSVREPTELVVVCDEAGATKYLLDAARVLGADVSDATASIADGSTQWTVGLSFTGDGQQRWTDLTREATQNDTAAPFDPELLSMNLDVDPDTGQWRFDPDAVEPYNRYEQAPGQAGPGCDASTVGDAGNCLVAIVLDNQVLSAPQITSVITGDAQITGDFTADEARQLAAKLQHGTLPLALEIESITSS
jgi:preprotein translocase subunit SecD